MTVLKRTKISLFSYHVVNHGFLFENSIDSQLVGLKHHNIISGNATDDVTTKY